MREKWESIRDLEHTEVSLLIFLIEVQLVSLETQERILSAVTDLTAVVTTISATADRAVAILGSGSTGADDPAVVQAVADLNNINQRLSDAVNAASPPPVP